MFVANDFGALRSYRVDRIAGIPPDHDDLLPPVPRRVLNRVWKGHAGSLATASAQAIASRGDLMTEGEFVLYDPRLAIESH